jgi:hypothetical protein
MLVLARDSVVQPLCRPRVVRAPTMLDHATLALLAAHWRCCLAVVWCFVSLSSLDIYNFFGFSVSCVVLNPYFDLFSCFFVFCFVAQLIPRRVAVAQDAQQSNNDMVIDVYFN